VEALLEKVRRTAVNLGDMAGVTARNAGRYAGQMVDVAKLNMRIFDLNSACGELLQKIGQLVYDTHLGRESRNEDLAGLLKELDDKYADIGELKERIAALRSGRECPHCGALCSREDKFCRDCGTAL
jgi:hypothetical protein